MIQFQRVGWKLYLYLQHFLNCCFISNVEGDFEDTEEGEYCLDGGDQNYEGKAHQLINLVNLNTMLFFNHPIRPLFFFKKIMKIMVMQN